MNNPLTREFNERLSNLKSLVIIMEESFAKQVIALDDEMAKSVGKLPESQRQDLYESYGADCYELSNELPTLFRYSIITASNSAFEKYLADTADTYAYVRKELIKVRDFRGRGIIRSQQYLKKVVRMDFPDKSPAWQGIVKVRDLRNCVVHADGYVAEEEKDLLAWINTTPGIHLENGCVIVIEPGFINTVFGWYNSFMDDFDNACPLGLWYSVFPKENGDTVAIP